MFLNFIIYLCVCGGVARQPLFFIKNRINCFLPCRLSISMCLGHHLFLKILLIEYSALNFTLNIALFRSVSDFNWVAHPLVSIFWSLSHAVCVQNSPPPLHSPSLPLPSASLFSVVVTWMLTGSACALTLVHGSFAFSWPYLYF